MNNNGQKINSIKDDFSFDSVIKSIINKSKEAIEPIVQEIESYNGYRIENNMLVCDFITDENISVPGTMELCDLFTWSEIIIDKNSCTYIQNKYGCILVVDIDYPSFVELIKEYKNGNFT